MTTTTRFWRLVSLPGSRGLRALDPRNSPPDCAQEIRRARQTIVSWATRVRCVCSAMPPRGLIEFLVTIRFCMCLTDGDVQVAILSAGASDVCSVLRG